MRSNQMHCKIFVRVAMCSLLWLSPLRIEPVLGVGGSSNNHPDQRFSFSLTTFSPRGQLSQVEYATRAATQTVSPVIAVALSANEKRNGGGGGGGDSVILIASPLLRHHQHTSPLVRDDDDDGTTVVPRISSLTPTLAVAPVGLAADGRVLVQAAQRAAIEHEYTFDENVPNSVLLEEVSLLLQRYTYKPGARPFGCALLVVGWENDDDEQPVFYKLLPSGVVESVPGSVAVLGGEKGMSEESVMERLQQEDIWNKTVDEATKILHNVLIEMTTKASDTTTTTTTSTNSSKPAVLIGTFGRHVGLSTKILRHKDT